jgi:lipopolysaccharide export system permease protein
MRPFGMGPTLRRYVLREVVTPFLFGIGVFTFILLTARMLKLVELVVNRGVPFLQIAKLFAYILPTFLEVTVPMALLLAVLLSVGRLSADSEIVALKTSGISLYQMVVPVLLFTSAVCVLSFLLGAYARPWGNSGLKASLYEIAKTRASAGLRERVFNDDFAGLVIYVEHVRPPGDQLEGILIADSRDPNQRNTVTAKRGFLVGNEATHSVTLRLLDGNIHTFTPDEQSYQKTDFSVYDVTLNLAVALARFSRHEKDAQEMTIGELRAAIAARTAAGQPANTELVELHRKFSLPFACLVFGLVAVPLGLQPVRAVRSRGFSVSLALIFLYYLLLTAGQAMAEKGSLPPMVALWIPNVVFGVLGTVLFTSAARESSLSLSGRVGQRLALLRAGRQVAPSS